jgi:DDE_Tnp_1-associated
MPALPPSLISLGCVAPPGTSTPASAAGLLEVLAELTDPRVRRGIRHRLVTVVAAAVCAVVAGCRSYTAIGEWGADLPVEAAARLGMNAGRRPSESMIRRLLQVLDAEHLAALAGRWLAERLPEPIVDQRRAIAVDGKTLRGSTSTTVADAAPHATDARSSAMNDQQLEYWRLRLHVAVLHGSRELTLPLPCRSCGAHAYVHLAVGLVITFQRSLRMTDSRTAQNGSIMELSQQSPTVPVDPIRPASRGRCPRAHDVYLVRVAVRSVLPLMSSSQVPYVDGCWA